MEGAVYSTGYFLVKHEVAYPKDNVLTFLFALSSYGQIKRLQKRNRKGCWRHQSRQIIRLLSEMRKIIRLIHVWN